MTAADQLIRLSLHTYVETNVSLHHLSEHDCRAVLLVLLDEPRGRASIGEDCRWIYRSLPFICLYCCSESMIANESEESKELLLACEILLLLLTEVSCYLS